MGCRRRRLVVEEQSSIPHSAVTSAGVTLTPKGPLHDGAAASRFSRSRSRRAQYPQGLGAGRSGEAGHKDPSGDLMTKVQDRGAVTSAVTRRWRSAGAPASGRQERLRPVSRPRRGDQRRHPSAQGAKPQAGSRPHRVRVSARGRCRRRRPHTMSRSGPRGRREIACTAIPFRSSCERAALGGSQACLFEAGYPAPCPRHSSPRR